MNIRHLPAQTRVARTWRNGGGVTHDIAVFPDGSGDDEFLWRASIATITDAGPFSTWPGVDRTLLVLQGRLALAFETRDEMQLDENSSSFAFIGEEHVVGSPMDGPCQVLNLMVRRDRIRIRLMSGSKVFPIIAGQTLLLATQSTTISVDGRPFHLSVTDALVLEPNCDSVIVADQSAIAVEFSAGKE